MPDRIEGSMVAVGSIFTILTVLFSSLFTSEVTADASLGDPNMPYTTGPECTGCSHGCCGQRGCCDSPSDDSDNSAEVRIIGVIGGFFLTLVLLFVCFLRVRCMAKRSQARRRTLRQQMGFGGNSRNQASGEGSTVFSLNVSQSGMAQFMIALSNLRRGSSGDNTLGEVIVQPPPYSEHDPITPPVPEYTESPTIPAPEVFLGPPPPYSYPKDGDAVVMGTQSAGGESSGGGTREDDNGTGPELENRQ